MLKVAVLRNFARFNCAEPKSAGLQELFISDSVKSAILMWVGPGHGEAQSNHLWTPSRTAKAPNSHMPPPGMPPAGA